MKKKIILLIIMIFLILFRIITYNVDKTRIKENKKPMIAFESPIYLEHGEIVAYYGLGYKVYRYTNVTPTELFESNQKLKMGSLFMEKRITNIKKVKYIKLYNGSSSVSYKYILENNISKRK